MSRELNTAAPADLPAAHVFVLGQRTHGTSEVIAALQSIDRPEGLVRFDPRVVNPPRTEQGEVVMLFNDFGPTSGAARLQPLVTPKRRFTLYECVNDVQALMMAGTKRCDAIVWVHSALAEVTLDPIAQMLDGAVFLGAQAATVFITDAHEASADTLDAIEQDTRELLSAAGFAGDDCAVVRSSGPIAPNAPPAWRAGALALRDTLDDTVPYAELDPTFVMPIEDTFDIRGRGLVVTGPVQRGSVAIGKAVDILRDETRTTVRVTALEISRKVTPVARAGQNIGIMLSDCTRNDIARGDLLVSPGAGLQGSLVRLRCYAWRAPAATIRPGERLAIVGNRDPRNTLVTLDRAVLSPGPFEAVLQHERPRPMMLGQPHWLTDGTSLFAVAFVERVLG
ncbi:MAG: hypothetical protein Q8Q09_23985 [Deltaproteobacteria bacterium]|nr:hypothetical protein [Deltaproteobacteria bacterium]